MCLSKVLFFFSLTISFGSYAFDCSLWLVANSLIRTELAKGDNVTGSWMMALRLQEAASMIHGKKSQDQESVLTENELREYRNLFGGLSFSDARAVIRMATDEVLGGGKKPRQHLFKEMLVRAKRLSTQVEVEAIDIDSFVEPVVTDLLQEQAIDQEEIFRHQLFGLASEYEEYQTLGEMPEVPYVWLIRYVGPFGIKDMYFVLGKIAEKFKAQNDALEFNSTLESLVINLEKLSKRKVSELK